MSVAPNTVTDTSTTGPVTIRFDGSVLDSTHHDDPSAAIGYVIDDSRRAVRLVEESKSLTYWVSNTHVEFDALLYALDHLLALNYTGHVNVNGDAKSVINLADPTTDHNPRTETMKTYVKNVQTRLNQFDSFTINYLKRDNNAEADALASRGHTAPPLEH